MLSGQDHLLPARDAALARFASLLTGQPWAITPELGATLATQGLDVGAIEVATTVVAMFNYLTRVADASGIEFDYRSPLPAFQPARDRAPIPRPARESWPVVGGYRTSFGPSVTDEPWRNWRAYVFDSTEPLTRRERRLLARAAAEETCDRWRADELAGYSPRAGSEAALDAFGRKLSLQPWRMGPADLQTLRDAGYSEPALLHAISVVALQNAESRLAMGRALTAGG